MATTALISFGGIAANAAELGYDPVAAVAAASPDAIADAANVATTETGGTAIDAKVGGTRIVVPADPAKGIKLGAADGTTVVGLPFAQQAGDVKVNQSGVVSYDNNNGSVTVPIVKGDGSVQINTVIRDQSAPTRYAYPLTVGDGESLRVSPDGSAYVGSDTGVPSAYISAPWAKDANGNAVATHYEAQGNTLVQVVEFTAATAFPVVADPTIMSTGQYDYYCVATSGAINYLVHGEPLSDCHGSYLQKYINGALVQTIPLTGYGAPANPAAFGTADCYISLAYATLSIYGPGWLVRFLSGAIGYVLSSGLPAITACRG